MKKVLSILLPLSISLGVNAQVYKVLFKPAGSRQINISLKNSNIEIVGTSGDSVTIIASDFKETNKKLLGDNSTGVNVLIKGNILDISKLSESPASYLVKVPKTISLTLKEELREPKLLSISNIAGSISANSWVSKLVLKDVTGPVQVSSQASDILVEYSTLSQF